MASQAVIMRMRGAANVEWDHLGRLDEGNAPFLNSPGGDERVGDHVLVLVLAAIPAYLTWKMPIAADWPVLIGVALFATMAQFCVASSISLADARVVQTMNFLRMPNAAGMGFMVFGEFPDLWTWVGALIIFSAAWYAVQQGKKR